MLKFNIIKFLASTNLQLLAEKQNKIELQKTNTIKECQTHSLVKIFEEK